MLDLHSKERNLHDLEAVSENGVAFFDVLCPPYGKGRDCTYYDIVQDLPARQPDCPRVELKKVPCPPELIVLHAGYHGETVDEEQLVELASEGG